MMLTCLQKHAAAFTESLLLAPVNAPMILRGRPLSCATSIIVVRILDAIRHTRTSLDHTRLKQG